MTINRVVGDLKDAAVDAKAENQKLREDLGTAEGEVSTLQAEVSRLEDALEARDACIMPCCPNPRWYTKSGHCYYHRYLMDGRILQAIQDERDRQDAKWGSQRDLAQETWLTILVEEVGEVAESILEGDPEGYAKELIQVAAVAVAALEGYYGGPEEMPLHCTECRGAIAVMGATKCPECAHG